MRTERTRRRSLRRSVARLAVDVSPLRTSRDFRLLWTGELISQTGHQITTVALFIQIDRITGSPAAVGAVGLVQLVPMIAVALGVGPVIDRRDRRGILLGAQAGLTGASVILFAGALAGQPPLALLYCAAALNAALTSIVMPTRAAMTPNLVPRELLPAAAALNQVMWNTAQIVGPAVGGIVVGRAGLAWAYGIDVATYVVAVAFAGLLRPQEPARSSPDSGQERGRDAVLAGVRYLRNKRVLQSTFTVDVIAMVFGMPRALFPVLARERFDAGEEAVGYLFAAVAAGALVGALSSGWVGRVRRPGRAVLVSVAVWGGAITAFGLADQLVPAMAFLGVAGAADVVSAVFRSTIQQTIVPDDLRGRLSSFNILVVAGGPRLGDFEAGQVAIWFSPAVSVVSGGLLCVAGVAVLAAAVPRFASWRIGDPP